jgi:serine/threonine protein kinase
MPEPRTALDSRVTELRARQLAGWEAGERVLLEPLLAGDSELLADEEALLHLIYAEVLLREEYGEHPGPEEYVRRFPSREAAIRRQFAFHAAFGALNAGASADAVSTTTGPVAPPRGADEALPELGPYTVLGELGRGGMGVVYKARHRTLTTRLAALKVLRHGAGGAEERERFLSEARAVAALHHPNVVRIYDVFTPPAGGGDPFVALEYVEGGSLADRIDGTPLPPREAAALLVPLAEAIHHAHRHGIVHRDLKPANVLLATDEHGLTQIRQEDSSNPIRVHLCSSVANSIPKLTDFGLAKQLDADSGRTRSGVILGTPSYMAPEQAGGRNHEVGPPADVYGLGAVLYECLTGRPPFKADTVLNTLAQVAAEEPVPPRSLQPGVPRDLETICRKCLEKAPGRRYASAAELAADLRRFLRGEPTRARPAGALGRAVKWVKRRPAAAALVGVSGLAAAVLVAVGVAFTIRLDEQKRDALAQRDEAVRQTLRAEREREEARKQKEVALAERAEARRQSKRARHLLALMATAVDEIAVNTRSGRIAEITSGVSGTVLFKLACFYAKGSKALSADPDLPAEDRSRLAEQYAASAVRLLGCAEQVGFFEPKRPENREALKKSADLAVLRSRADYQRLAARLR